LTKKYSLFERGFRVRIAPALQRRDRDSLTMAISAFKYVLCLGKCNKRAVISALLGNKLSSAQVETILRSPWSCPSILPLDQNNSGPDEFTSGLHFDTVAIDFAECHQHIGLQCLHILRRPLQSPEDVVAYAKSRWISHLVKYSQSSSEQTKIFNALTQNLSAILTSDNARKAIAWVEV
jgi:hypothetical protein